MTEYCVGRVLCGGFAASLNLNLHVRIEKMTDKENTRSIGRREDDFIVRSQLDRQKDLLYFGRIIVSENDVDGIFDIIINQANQLMHTERCSLFLHNAKNCELWSLVAIGMNRNQLCIPDKSGVIGWVLNNQEAVIINDAYSDPRFFSKIDEKTGFKTRNILCSPLINRKKICIGVIQALNKTNGDFNDNDKELFLAISDYLVIALENAKLVQNLKGSNKNLKKAQLKLRDYSKNLERKVEERTAELRSVQNKLIEAEKRSIEHRMTGGFAHEMRNALAGAQLEFKAALNYQDRGVSATDHLKKTATTLLKNISILHERYNIPRNEIAQLLIPEIKTIAEVADHLSLAISGVSRDLDRGLAITSQIRDYAKLVELKPGKEAIELMNLFHEYERRYKINFAESGITFGIEGPERLVVHGDELHFNSIFSNLILNARDALIEKKSPNAKISIVVEDTKNRDDPIFIIICDNGPGISKEHLEEIFEPFFSTKPTTGTGLGLGIAKRLVQLYDGQIHVESSLGEGTKFTITLPAKMA